MICVGDQGIISLEGKVCAGMIIALCECQSQKYDIHYDDSLIAYRLYQKFSHDLFAMM